MNLVDPYGLKDVYFLYHYTNSKKDKGMRNWELGSVKDDIKKLKQKGFTVKLDKEATKADILNAMYDPSTKAIIDNGHGYKTGGLQTNDGLRLIPGDVDSSRVSPNLQFVALESCHQGSYKPDWQRALGAAATIVGWDKRTSTLETKSFNRLGWFDGKSKNLSGHLKDLR